MASTWCRFGVDLVPIWCRFGIVLVSIWYRFGVDLVWCRFGVDLVSIWCPLGVDLPPRRRGRAGADGNSDGRTDAHCLRRPTQELASLASLAVSVEGCPGPERFLCQQQPCLGSSQERFFLCRPQPSPGCQQRHMVSVKSSNASALHTSSVRGFSTQCRWYKCQGDVVPGRSWDREKTPGTLLKAI